MNLGRWGIALVLGLFISGCAGPARNTLYQYAPFEALLAGGYDGDLTLSELRRHGSLGIGTYENLDGEMILLDGEFYQVKGDGRVVTPPDTLETPFAAVSAFRPDQTVALPQGADLAAVQQLLDAAAPNPNEFVAIRIDGQFRRVRARSVPAQERPFPPLKEVVARQSVFEFQNLSGTLVGFRCPPYVGGLNVPGYHLHFISQDRSRGGHVLEFEIITGTAQVDRLDRLNLRLPRTADFAAQQLGAPAEAPRNGTDRPPKK